MAKSTKAPSRSIVVGQTALNISTKIERVPLVKGLAATVNGLIVEGQPSLEVVSGAGHKLRVIEKGAQFAIGDWIIYLKARFGDDAYQVLDPDTGWSEKTLGVYEWLAGRIAIDDRRMDRLGIRHHLLVARLAAQKQRQWLSKAAADDEEHPWTVGRLKQAMEAGHDLPVEKWYVIVEVPDAARQTSLMDDLERQGLHCTARQSRRKKTAEPETPAA